MCAGGASALPARSQSEQLERLPLHMPRLRLAELKGALICKAYRCPLKRPVQVGFCLLQALRIVSRRRKLLCCRGAGRQPKALDSPPHGAGRHLTEGVPRRSAGPLWVGLCLQASAIDAKRMGRPPPTGAAYVAREASKLSGGPSCPFAGRRHPAELWQRFSRPCYFCPAQRGGDGPVEIIGCHHLFDGAQLHPSQRGHFPLLFHIYFFSPHIWSGAMGVLFWRRPHGAALKFQECGSSAPLGSLFGSHTGTIRCTQKSGVLWWTTKFGLRLYLVDS